MSPRKAESASARRRHSLTAGHPGTQKRDGKRDEDPNGRQGVTVDVTLPAASASADSVLAAHTPVRLLRKSSVVLGVTCVLRGGRGEIVEAHVDHLGAYYVVHLSRSGRTRYARPGDLCVMHAARDPRPDRNAPRVRVMRRTPHAG